MIIKACYSALCQKYLNPEESYQVSIQTMFDRGNVYNREYRLMSKVSQAVNCEWTETVLL